jgi:hypothetical protein
MRLPSRRAVVGLLAASSCYLGPRCRAALAGGVAPRAVATGLADGEADAEALEAQLISLLEAAGTLGLSLRAQEAMEVEQLIGELANAGGSQREAAEGIGSWGSWIGSWEVLYCRPNFIGGPLSLTRSNAQLVSARQFVYGPADAAVDLSGVGRDGGISTESLYTLAVGENKMERLLLSRSGSFTKLPAYDFRVDFTTRAHAYELSSIGLGAQGDPAAVSALSMPAITPLASPQRALDIVDKPEGSSLRQISYLSERLWISRGGADDGVAVLRRVDAVPLVPPPERPDLTATCAEAVFVRASICRKQALF